MNLTDKQTIQRVLKALGVKAETIKSDLDVDRLSEYDGSIEDAVLILIHNAAIRLQADVPESIKTRATVSSNVLGFNIEVTGNSVIDIKDGYYTAIRAITDLRQEGFHELAMRDGTRAQPTYSAEPPPMPEDNPPPPAGSPPPAAGSQPTGSPPPAGNGNPPIQGPTDIKRGVAQLHEIGVDSDGKVKFKVGGFKWPFQEGRGAEMAASLFDTDLGWNANHFKPGAHYGPEICGPLHVEWEKPGKYYNVIRVFKQI